MRAVVVTGVSSGIGHGTARVLIDRGVRVFGTVRKPEDAERLHRELGQSFTALLCDVTDEAAVGRAADEVRSQLPDVKLFGLVNNAGVAVPGPLLHLSIAEFRRQIEVNLIGALIVTQAFAPILGAERGRQGPSGRIVNMSSVAGRFGYPFLGAYVASKHALEGLSESLRRELMPYGIDVIVIGPGSVATPIWDKAEHQDLGVYDQTDYAPMLGKFRKYMLDRGRQGFPPERVGEVVWEALTSSHPKVRYAVVPNRLRNWTIPQLVPRRLIDRALARQFGWR